MDNIGLDLHQRESQLCILTDDGEVIERRIRTTSAPPPSGSARCSGVGRPRASCSKPRPRASGWLASSRPWGTR